MSESASYQERLRVPLRWWAQGTMLVATLWLTLIVALIGHGYRFLAYALLAVYVVPLLTIGLARLLPGLWTRQPLGKAS